MSLSSTKNIHPRHPNLGSESVGLSRLRDLKSRDILLVSVLIERSIRSGPPSSGGHVVETCLHKSPQGYSAERCPRPQHLTPTENSGSSDTGKSE